MEPLYAARPTSDGIPRPRTSPTRPPVWVRSSPFPLGFGSRFRRCRPAGRLGSIVQFPPSTSSLDPAQAVPPGRGSDWVRLAGFSDGRTVPDTAIRPQTPSIKDVRTDSPHHRFGFVRADFSHRLRLSPPPKPSLRPSAGPRWRLGSFGRILARTARLPPSETLRRPRWGASEFGFVRRVFCDVRPLPRPDAKDPRGAHPSSIREYGPDCRDCARGRGEIRVESPGGSNSAACHQGRSGSTTEFRFRSVNGKTPDDFSADATSAVLPWRQAISSSAVMPRHNSSPALRPRTVNRA